MEISLPFWNNGKPFAPQIFVEDVADMEDRWVAYGALPEAQRTSSALLRAKLPLVQAALGREPPADLAATLLARKQDTLRLTAAELNRAWQDIWVKGQDPREATAPLANAGDKPAPSSSPA